MKVIHNNSREEFDLSYPQYYKYYSVYGLLVMGGIDIFFISNAELNDCVCVTDEFTTLS